jgi:hypothetical protein
LVICSSLVSVHCRCRAIEPRDLKEDSLSSVHFVLGSLHFTPRPWKRQMKLF